MATWNDVVSHLNSNFKCEKLNDGLISLKFSMSDNRTQLVFVEQAGNENVGEWAAVSSAVGSMKDVNKLKAFCTAVKDWVCGGIVIDGDYIMVRDTFPLANLDVNELEVPLLAVVNAADYIEKNVTGGDSY